MKRPLYIILFVVFSFTLTVYLGPISAQLADFDAKPGRPIPDTSIDGTVGSEWDDANYYSGVAIDPIGEAEIWIKHDGTYLYMALKFNADSRNAWIAIEIGSSACMGEDIAIFGDDNLNPDGYSDAYFLTIQNVLADEQQDGTGAMHVGRSVGGTGEEYPYTIEMKKPLNSGDTAGKDANWSEGNTYVTAIAWDSDGIGLGLNGGSSGGSVRHWSTPSTERGIYIEVIPPPPVASFTYSPSEPSVNQTITFDASASTPNGGDLVNPDSYAWDFDTNGIIDAYGVIVNHTYFTEASFTVTLNVTDSDGISDVMIQELTVGRPPKASFSISPSTPSVDETITFDASSSTPNGGNITSYTWNLGDATTDAGKIVYHAYNASGTYIITLNITDDRGLWDIITEELTVGRPPKASFSISPSTPSVDETITFDASSSTPNGGNITSYTWNFGDGLLGSGKTITHQYSETGDYTTTLNVTDSEGLWSTISETVTVTETELPWFWVGIGIDALIVLTLAVAVVFYRKK